LRGLIWDRNAVKAYLKEFKEEAGNLALEQDYSIPEADKSLSNEALYAMSEKQRLKIPAR
jgi:uncharacterized protein YpuA (DUF1002 family)